MYDGERVRGLKKKHKWVDGANHGISCESALSWTKLAIFLYTKLDIAGPLFDRLLIKSFAVVMSLVNCCFVAHMIRLVMHTRLHSAYRVTRWTQEEEDCRLAQRPFHGFTPYWPVL